MSAPTHPANPVALALPHDSIDAILTKPSPVLRLRIVNAPTQHKNNFVMEGPLTQVSRWHDFNFQNLANAFRDVLSCQTLDMASEEIAHIDIPSVRALSTFGVEYISRYVQAPISLGARLLAERLSYANAPSVRAGQYERLPSGHLPAISLRLDSVLPNNLVLGCVKTSITWHSKSVFLVTEKYLRRAIHLRPGSNWGDLNLARAQLRLALVLIKAGRPEDAELVRKEALAGVSGRLQPKDGSSVEEDLAAVEWFIPVFQKGRSTGAYTIAEANA